MERKTPSENSHRRWPGGRLASDTPWNYADRRGRTERRLLYDRRELIRFENDRRVSHERRRGLDPWAIP